MSLDKAGNASNDYLPAKIFTSMVSKNEIDDNLNE